MLTVYNIFLFLYELASLIASSQVIRLEYPPFSTTKELIQISSKQKKKSKEE